MSFVQPFFKENRPCKAEIRAGLETLQGFSTQTTRFMTGNTDTMEIAKGAKRLFKL